MHGLHAGSVCDATVVRPDVCTSCPAREPEDCHSYARGRVGLLGDAAHLTAAALGQVSARLIWPSLPSHHTLQHRAGCPPQALACMSHFTPRCFRVSSWRGQGEGGTTHCCVALPLTAASSCCWYAQGTSQTMEDALELGRAVALHGLTPQALSAYEAARYGSIQ